jgi:hypothetical protein
MTPRNLFAAAIMILALIVLTPLAVLAGHAIADIVEQKVAELPCAPGSVKKIVREADSCLGDYSKRVANEPIAFCVRSRTSCVRAADGGAAPAPATESE